MPSTHRLVIRFAGTLVALAALALGLVLAPSGPARLRVLRQVTLDERAHFAPLAPPAPVAPPTPAPTAPPAAPKVAPAVAEPMTPLHAVIIGVDHARGSTPLEGAVNDAVKLRDALVAYGFPADGIALLIEGQATRDSILRAAARLALVPSSGTVVFGYAGHGRITKGVGRIVAGDGSTVSATELAAVLSLVKARMWATFTQCYAGTFDVPGIVGPGRVVTFAADASSLAYEWQGSSGLGRFMVERAMLAGQAAGSVEDAYDFALAGLTDLGPHLTPYMVDRYDGELVLGPVRGA